MHYVYLLQSAVDHRQPEVGAREGIAALQVTRAVLESSRTGHAIDLPE